MRPAKASRRGTWRFHVALITLGYKPQSFNAYSVVHCSGERYTVLSGKTVGQWESGIRRCEWWGWNRV